MKKHVLITSLLLFSMALLSCEKNDDPDVSATLTVEDTAGLLFMLEEEKMARDVYSHLNEFWGTNQFNNIKESEITHVAAVVSLLQLYDIPYTLLPQGEYNNTELQAMYTALVEQGETSSVNALKVGATIEDLDIVDLETFITATANSAISNVYEILQCGSRNHLKSFVQAIENSGSTYEPQYLSPEAYTQIINSTKEFCR